MITGTAGNPELRPYRANAADLSFEKYWGTKGYVSLQLFYKYFDTFVVEQNLTNVPFDYTGYPIPSPAIFDKIGTAFRRAVGRFAEARALAAEVYAATPATAARVGTPASNSASADRLAAIPFSAWASARRVLSGTSRSACFAIATMCSARSRSAQRLAHLGSPALSRASRDPVYLGNH